MSLHHRTPAQLRLLIDEVRYLHALWHHGNPNPNPSPPLGPTTRPSFKKTPKNHTSNKKINKIRDKINTKNHTAAATEWAVPPDPDPAPAPGPTGWAMWPILPPALRTLNAPEDLAWIASVKAQDDALTACDDFFVPRDGSTITSDDDMDGDDVAELGVLKFFSGLFQSDENLREYYTKNCNDGYFHCLVCWGIGKKGRRYPNCVGLVQHAKSVTKTKLQLAHRDFAKVVCEVLGWDINKLPSIVLDLAEPLGETIGKNDQTQEGDN